MRNTLFKSDNLHVFSSGKEAASGSLLVCGFQNRASSPALDAPGFGEDFLVKEAIDGLFFNCATNAWWQYPELPEALDTALRYASAFERTVCYGSSMGGYAAMRFADAIGASRVIAAAPQFSPRRSVVPRETRYEADVETVEFLHEATLLPSLEIDRYVIYDPLLSADKDHVDRYEAISSLTRVPMPCAGHPPLALLASQGQIRAVVLSLLRDAFNVQTFSREQRSLRRQTYRYWEQLSYHLAQRGHLLRASLIAEYAASVLPDHHDAAVELALRWAMWSSNFDRATSLTQKLPVDNQEAARMWAQARARQKSLTRPAT